MKDGSLEGRKKRRKEGRKKERKEERNKLDRIEGTGRRGKEIHKVLKCKLRQGKPRHTKRLKIIII